MPVCANPRSSLSLWRLHWCMCLGDMYALCICLCLCKVPLGEGTAGGGPGPGVAQEGIIYEPE